MRNDKEKSDDDRTTMVVVMFLIIVGIIWPCLLVAWLIWG